MKLIQNGLNSHKILNPLHQNHHQLRQTLHQVHRHRNNNIAHHRLVAPLQLVIKMQINTVISMVLSVVDNQHPHHHQRNHVNQQRRLMRPLQLLLLIHHQCLLVWLVSIRIFYQVYRWEVSIQRIHY